MDLHTSTTSSEPGERIARAFFIPALALSLAAVVTGIASLGNTFEGALASLIALLPTLAALILGHLTAAASQPARQRLATLGGLGLAYLALALVVISTIT